MSTTDVLAAGGIQRAADVSALAEAARLELAAAATLLGMESGGGANIWGHDAVPTGGAYVKGGPVTEGNYRAYRDALLGGKAKPQGCGPTQLTWRPYQALADTRGGCWRWEVNAAVGFEVLAGHLREHGDRGFAAYNGSGPAARAYGERAAGLLASWRRRLGVLGNRTLRRGDRGDDVRELQKQLHVAVDGVFGPGTEAAVRAVQAARGLAVDGIVGPLTWGVL